MKKITYIITILSIITFGCDDTFELEDQDLRVKFLAGKYVAFNAPGANTSIDPEEADEGNDLDLNVEIPTGTLSDVTVNFSFSGTAVYGVDFTVAGATAAGGSITIEPLPGDDQTDVIDNADISVSLLPDGNTDGPKTLIVTLTDAYNSEGNILVGRGGTDLLKARTINIVDID